MKTEVLIIGAGIAGLASALLLADAGLKVTIIEKRAFPIPNAEEHYGRTAALMGASVNILKALGVWEDIHPQTARLAAMRIIDDSNPATDPVIVDFPAKAIGRDEFGYNVPNIMLNALLAERATAHKNITLMDKTGLEGYEALSHTLIATLDNGEKIETPLLIGADGKFSKVRQLAGITTSERLYGQSAITCLITHSKPHENISTEHHRAGGPFTLVPMPDKDGKHYSSVVWVEKTVDSDGFMALDKPSLEHALQKRTRNAYGEVKLASTPESWPLKGILAEDITAPRMALIAEAAHVMSPIGAQGLNLSLRDVATLVETIIDAARVGEDIGAPTTLNAYASRRKLDLQTRFNGVDGYNRIVSNNLGFLRGLRRVGLKSLRAVPALKNFAMTQGLSPRMDEGRLMRGEPL